MRTRATTSLAFGLACLLAGCSCGSSEPTTSPASAPPSSAPTAPPAPPTTAVAPPTSVVAAAVAPFVADVWLLRADPEDDDEPGRRVAVILRSNAEGPRPDGLEPLGSAIAHEGTFTFYRVRELTPPPLTTITALSIDATCEAPVTHATEARVAVDAGGDEPVADMDALVLDFDGCIESAFVAGPGAVVVHPFSLEDDAQFAPASPALVTAVGAALAGPLRSHALPRPDMFIVGNADRFCVVRGDRNDCDSMNVPYAEVSVGADTFLLLHGENDDYAAPLDRVLP